MDGFTYEQTIGGWHVCDICGARVSHELKHQAWHWEQAANTMNTFATILETFSLPPDPQQTVQEYQRNDLFRTLAFGLRMVARD